RCYSTQVLFAGFLLACTAAQRRPPNYSLDDMPDTNFNCRDKILGGYYADPETDCQMFHVCVKVPGVGVQDYRFLCPNDTSFDQENQICANWFDIDCEATTLYYSDNFDLYRIGYNPSSPSLGTSNVTPIPLGPSSIRPPVSKARPRYQNTRPSDEEEDYFLQRSETGDSRRQQKDLLRGSSSSNFFNPNKGKENEDEDETYRDNNQKSSSNDSTYRRPSNGNKKKVAVRKLVKRPNNSFIQEGENYPTPKPTTVPPTTFSQNNRGSNSYDNYNYNNNQGNSFGKPKQQNYNTGDYNNPLQLPSSNYYTPTTEKGAITVSNDRTPRTGNNYYQPRYNTIQRNNAQGSTTPQPSVAHSPATNNYNYQQQSESNDNTQGNNYNIANYYSTFSAQKSTTPKPIQYSTTQATTANYYNYQSQQRSTNTQVRNTKNNGANPDNYPTTANYPVSKNNDYNFANYNGNTQNSQSTNAYTKSTANNYTPTTFETSTYDAYNSGNNQKRFGNGYNQRSTDYSNTKSTVGFISTTTLSPASNVQTYNNYQQSINEDYNNFNNYDYQRTNNFGHNNANTGDAATADDKTDSEFLKTAPSNNYRPSSFNTFQNNYNANSKPTTTLTKNYNYTTTTTASDNRSSQNYNSNYYNSNTTPKTTSYTTSEAYTLDRQSSAGNSNYYSQSTIFPPAPFSLAETNPTTRRPQTTASQNYPSSSKDTVSTANYNQKKNNNYNAYSVSSTTVRASEYENAGVKDGTKKALAPGSKPGEKTTDVSYDYAYYDDSNTEYDGLDPVSDHHFGKGGESLKVARSTE
ncbi:hypothetical protein Cfor_11985, partial [Coptotermes formosanus]